MEKAFRFYLNSKAIFFHKGLSLKSSTVDDPKSGYGLFIDPTKFSGEEVNNGTVQLLRIPKLFTFDINTLLALLGDEDEFTSKEQFQRTNNKIKTALREIMEYPGFSRFLTETNLLIIYFMIFQSIFNSYEIPGSIKYYLKNILMNSDVETAMDTIEDLATDYGHYPQIFGLQETLKLFKDLFLNLLNVNDIKHLYSAIISRCLEIPEKSGTKGQEFTVHSTLVPVLDFANHENTRKNAYFDIDPANNDVLLLLNADVVQERGANSVEVFISYTPTDNLFSMLLTYGFAPDFKGYPQFWTVSLDRSFLRDYNGLDLNAELRTFYKWLHVNPVVSLVKHEHNGQVRWFINDTTPKFDEILLPFIPPLGDARIARWAYDSACHLMFAKMHCLVNPETKEHAAMIAEKYRSLIQDRELNGDDFINLPPLAWSLRFKDTKSGCMLQRHMNSEEAIAELQREQRQDAAETRSRFVDFFRSFLKYRKSRITKLTSNSNVTSALFAQELEIIDDLATAIDKSSTIFFSDLNVVLDVEPSTFPPLRFLHDHMEISEKTEKPVRKCEDPASYTSGAFTDFFEDETNQYVAFFGND
ncbi:cytochrome c lysine N-methyltransferase SKDI_08G1550 [Saccharomyces kudriavzevii IFO 1802]|uniref:CTM1-like protein n=2 Tax=Saccharomyces kudriavzevii (strain ATCC MYA-4449 / AS 2.2408 / CBS 8840 / NBRC 1802 / NCYC 2889) TaxID=226230 RepID=J4U243_SACK1|nr:uncharacterized protein SKDI_08G1550 [Saccharomyces kudriavzevii IFO 1802]EJT44055.1 CTM1-like protein [Saccharomyces kudriavzevii IFO 1802]CAI4063836.1 hypothetical protein SKDI_08G1550 [Saccharomyces kudriavzevii IFO 1802]